MQTLLGEPHRCRLDLEKQRQHDQWLICLALILSQGALTLKRPKYILRMILFRVSREIPRQSLCVDAPFYVGLSG